MRVLVLTLVTLASLASAFTPAAIAEGYPYVANVAAAPAVAAEAQSDLQRAVAFWAKRGGSQWVSDVCPGGVHLEFFRQVGGPLGTGGTCEARINLYWTPPNRWAAPRDWRCLTMFHEVGHALNVGHTETGLMAVRNPTMPFECVTNVTHRKGAVRYASNMKRKTISSQPKVRSHVARAAWDATGGGPHGGPRRAQRRRDRQSTKRALRAGSED